MNKKYKCEICNKEIEHGNLCTKCSDRINGFLLKIKESIHLARDKQKRKKHQ